MMTTIQGANEKWYLQGLEGVFIPVIGSYEREILYKIILLLKSKILLFLCYCLSLQSIMILISNVI